jgi:hypothetical protein
MEEMAYVLYWPRSRIFRDIVVIVLEADCCAVQIGFGVLASIPTSNTVYPLLGRPHDSLAGSGHGDG